MLLQLAAHFLGNRLDWYGLVSLVCTGMYMDFWSSLEEQLIVKEFYLASLCLVSKQGSQLFEESSSEGNCLALLKKTGLDDFSTM